jgi:hypothetical protein
MRMSFGRAIVLGGLPTLLLALVTSSASAQPAGGNPPPPKGFEADSASFVSAQTGFVLGTHHCSRLPCKALLEKTVDGGKTWASVPAPAVSLVPVATSSPPSAVSAVRFASASDGWLFGPGLWATTDGGAKWRQASVPGEVVALATSDGAVFASIEPASGGLNAARLYRSQVGGTKWTLVPGVVPEAALAVFGHSVWAGIAPELWTSTDSGKHWSKLSFTCPATKPAATAVAAASTADVALACSDQSSPQPGLSIKRVFTSSNGGRTFHLVGRPGTAGNVGFVAMVPGHPQEITLEASSGATFLYRSVDGGKTWKMATFSDGGLAVRDLAYVSASTGYLVHFGGGQPVIAYGLGLMKTVNVGASWKTVKIP